jgi:hypothetical protein
MESCLPDLIILQILQRDAVQPFQLLEEIFVQSKDDLGTIYPVGFSCAR